jgi:hypothetical protein
MRPTFSRESAHRWRWRCQPYAPAALYHPETFLVLISVRGLVDPRAAVRLKGLGQLKNSMNSSGLECRSRVTVFIVCNKHEKLNQFGIDLLKIIVFWVMTLCNLVDSCECFGGTLCFHPQGKIISSTLKTLVRTRLHGFTSQMIYLNIEGR